MKEKTIEMLMGDKELTFNVTLEDYNQCVNALQMDNKVAPMHNFLVVVSADEKTKEAVKQAYEDALTSDLFGALVKEYKPDVEITVKKIQQRAQQIEQEGLTQLEALANHWFPTLQISEEIMARALWMEKEHWQRLQKVIANGVSKAFSGKKR